MSLCLTPTATAPMPVLASIWRRIRIAAHETLPLPAYVEQGKWKDPYRLPGHPGREHPFLHGCEHRARTQDGRTLIFPSYLAAMDFQWGKPTWD